MLCELSQVQTLFLILLLRPKQHLWDLKENRWGLGEVRLNLNIICHTNINTKTPLHLNFIEELSIKKSELICNLMTAEVMKSSRPVKETQTIT